MPDIDGGHYFLTALVPVATEPTRRDDGSVTAPSHALREALASLPTAAQSEACVISDRISPFARCHRTHFARLFVLDQPAYNGRDPTDAVIGGLRKTDLLAHQPVDCLPCPWLFVVIDFDARPEEPDGGLASYLTGLWRLMQPELQDVFGHCHDFARVRTADDFVAYVRSCKVETTMPFNDYWQGAPPLPALSQTALVAIFLGIAAALVLVEVVLLTALGASLRWLWGGVPVALVLAAWLWTQFVLRRGARPFPTAPGSDLPGVLKALYVQQRFARFAIDHQQDDAASLHAAFGAFVAETRPADTAAPTRLPGTIAP